MVNLNEETHRMLKEFQAKLREETGMNLSLSDVIGFVLKYGPKPEDYWFKPASELKHGS
jgi:hypothetical protein